MQIRGRTPIHASFAAFGRPAGGFASHGFSAVSSTAIKADHGFGHLAIGRAIGGAYQACCGQPGRTQAIPRTPTRHPNKCLMHLHHSPGQHTITPGHVIYFFRFSTNISCFGMEGEQKFPNSNISCSWD